MFPIKWNDAYRKKDGTMTTMEEACEGGGGGGSEGVYVGTDDPDAELGEDGDYYYKRSNQLRWLQKITIASTSSQLIYGNEVTMLKNTTITALTARLTETKTGSIRIGNATEVLETVSDVNFVSGEWIVVPLSIPIEVEVGDTIIVQVVLESAGGLAYTQSSSSVETTDVAQFVHGRYGSSYPGTIDTARIPVSFIYEDGVFHVTNQYIKEDGSWVEL